MQPRPGQRRRRIAGIERVEPTRVGHAALDITPQRRNQAGRVHGDDRVGRGRVPGRRSPHNERGPPAA